MYRGKQFYSLVLSMVSSLCSGCLGCVSSGEEERPVLKYLRSERKCGECRPRLGLAIDPPL